MLLRDFHKDAIITNDHRVTYDEMLRRISLFSQQFPKSSGEDALLPAQERRKVVVFSENREGYIYAFFSVWLNNCIAVPVDAMSKAAELAYILGNCKPDVIWTTKGKLPTVEAALSSLKNEVESEVLLIDDFERVACPENLEQADLQYELEQTALIIYTSGTTGHAKGVMLSFLNLMTNIK